MSLSPLRARHLSIFLAVARTGTMQRAAREVHLTQPAISKLIGELEAIFGAPLFERGRRGVSLTECGHVLARRAEAMLNEIDDVGHEIDAVARGLVGRIRIGVLPIAESRILPATLLALRQRAPSLSVRIEEGTRAFLLNALRRGEIDCVIGRLRTGAEEDDLHCEKLVQMPVQIVASPSHPLARSRRLTWSNLACYPWILPQVGAPIRNIIDRQFAEAGVAAPTPAIESTSIRLNYAVIRVTDMIGVMTDDAATAYVKIGDLTVLRIAVPDRLPDVGVMLRSAHVSSAMLMFLNALRAQCREIVKS